jgi:lactoylglutathione lyase
MKTPKQKIAVVAVIVKDYDEAISYYTTAMGFRLIENSDLGNGKRWVLVAPANGDGACLLLAKAASAAQQSRIGNQTGGRVFLFLHTDDFNRDYQAMASRGVKFCEKPRHEPYGTVAIFEDLYGNRWDLLQPS